MRSLQRGAVAALLVTTALAAVACGGGGSAASAGTTAPTTSTSAAGAATGANDTAFAKYAACLEQNGVALPTFGSGRPPGGGAGGGQGNPPTGTNAQGGQGRPRSARSATFQKAAAACAKLRPTGFRGGGFGGGPAGGNGASSPAFAAYRNCLTLHGVKLSALRGGGAAPTSRVQKALTACASLRPSRQAPTSTTPAPTTTS